MKKYDFFMLIIACGLIAFGYYFTKKFTTDKDHKAGFELKIKNIEQKSNRLPSEDKNEDGDAKSSDNDVSGSDIPESQAFINKFVELKKCITSQDCDFSQDDPRSYELGIYQAINDHLKNVDVLPENLKKKVLFQSAKLPDGFVKETVLKKIMDEKIYSEVWRDMVLNEYIGQYNSKLIPDAISYLKTFSSDQDKQVIHQRIFAEISNGSPKVANALAENLKQLLDEKSALFYKSQISNLEDGPIKKNLNREIIDFEMKSSAG